MEMYFDNNATQPVKKSCIKDIDYALETYYGNPSSIYEKGRESSSVLYEARMSAKKSIRATEKCKIIFTSGGSESNNLAIKGFVFNEIRKIRNSGNGKIFLLVGEIEHKSALKSAEELSTLFNEVEYCEIKVDSKGKINLAHLKQKLDYIKKNYTNAKILVSTQYVNNEIGTINRIKSISYLVHDYNAVYHVDGVQAFGKLNIDVEEQGIDMLSVSGHKIGLPKGIGFLYVRNNVELSPLISGGKQENNLRAGTENIAYIYALGKACEIVSEANESYYRKLHEKYLYLYSAFFRGLDKKYNEKNPSYRTNGSLSSRLWNNISISFKDIDGESLMLSLDLGGYSVSNGSACNSGVTTNSYVLEKVDTPKDYIGGTIRITYDSDVDLNDIYRFGMVVAQTVNKLYDSMS